MTIIIFLIILAVLVFVHELGHFLAAKLFGIRVDEFSIGFPPRLIKKKIGETLYSLNLIPFGGYVKIFGENPNAESTSGTDSPRSFVHKPKWVQIIVLAAGVFGNIVFAWLLIVSAHMIGLPTSVTPENQAYIKSPHIIITSVAPNTPAATSGIRLSDTLQGIHSESGSLLAETVTPEAVQTFICAHGQEELTFDVLRAGKPLALRVTPQEGIVPNCAAVGIVMEYVGFLKSPFHRAIIEGSVSTAKLTGATANGLVVFVGGIFRGTANFEEVSGPIGIASMVGDAESLGFSYLVFFTALISINLAVINVVPFPALDGGRILFVLIEAVRRKALNPKVANAVNAAGFLLLMVLLIILTYRDILKL